MLVAFLVGAELAGRISRLTPSAAIGIDITDEDDDDVGRRLEFLLS